MSIDAKQRDLILRAVREGCTIAEAARRADVHRTRVHDLAKADREFGAELATARAAGRKAPQETSTRGLVSAEDELPPERISEFCRQVYKTRSIPKAALAAGIDLFPRRVTPADLSRKSRALMRDLLDSLGEGPDPDEMSPADRAKWAVGRWMAGEPWPTDLPIDLSELRAISKRAARDYERELLVREAERAAGE